jgi:O-antigen/teichoic acid export membrane protein
MENNQEDIVSSNSRIAKNTIVLYFRMIIQVLISLYTSRLVLQALGVVDYGLFGVVAGLASTFTVLNSCLSAATSRFIVFNLGRNDKEELQKTFCTSLYSHTILAIIIVILCEAIGVWFLNNEMNIPAERLRAANIVFQCSTFIIFVSLIQIPYGAVIIAHERMTVFAFTSILDAVLKLGLIIWVKQTSGDKLIEWSCCNVLLVLIGISLNLFFCRKYKEIRLKRTFELKRVKSLLNYSAWELIGSTQVMLQGQGLNILLNMFFSPVVNAARAIAFQVQGLAAQFSGNFMTATKPQIIKLYAAGRITEMLNLFFVSSRISFLLFLIVSLPICFNLSYVLTLWLGEYPPYTISFTLIIMIQSLFTAIKDPRITAVHATGNLKKTNLYIGLTMLLIFPVAYVALYFGASPNAVLLIALFFNLGGELIATKILKELIPQFSIKKYLTQVYLRSIAVAIIASIAPMIVCLLMPESLTKAITVAFTAVASTAIIAYYIGLADNERQRVVKVIKQRNPFKRIRRQ